MEVARSSQWKGPVPPECAPLSHTEAFLRTSQSADYNATSTDCTMSYLDNLHNGRAALGQSVKRLVNLMITPNSVPAFTIPRTYPGAAASTNRLTCSRTGSFSSLTDAELCGVVSSHKCSKEVTPPHSAVYKNGSEMELMGSNFEPLSPADHPLLADGVPCHSHTSYAMVEQSHNSSSNADPYSSAAMTLPHLRTKTSFGFEMLSECPNTKRKESLFHGDFYGIKSASGAWTGFVPSINKCKHYSSNPALSVIIDNSLENERRKRSKRQNVLPQVTPLGVSSSPHSSVDSNLSCSSSPSVMSSAHSSSTSPKRSNNSTSKQSRSNAEETSPALGLAEKRKRFREGCSAAVNQDDVADPQIAIPASEDCAGLADGHFSRYGHATLSANNEDRQQLWQAEALTNTDDTSRSYPDPKGDPRDAMVISQAWNIKGQLKFSLHYSHAKRHLAVHLIQGVKLGGTAGHKAFSSCSKSAFAKLFLHPCSMGQRHTSNVVKMTADPVFNQMFTFTNVTTEQLRTQKLRIRVLSREGLLRRQELLGELDVTLSELDFIASPDHELLRDLETEEIPRELGRLQAKICFQANTETLDVTLVSVKDLLHKSIIGSPDTYILVQLRQPGQPDVKRVCKLQRKATSTTINETFCFHISPRIEDLNYTCLSLTVYDRKVIGADLALGSVRLGFGATEASEFEHWNEVLIYPGKGVTKWHMLMEEQ